MQFLRKWWFHIVGLGLMSAILVWGIMAKPVTSATDKDTYVRFYDGWSQLVDGEYVPLEDIHLFYDVPEGEPLVFRHIIPEINEPKALLFYSENQEVQCYVDGELIQKFAIQEGFETLDTPGSAWNQVDISVDMSGKICDLIISSPIEHNQHRVNELFFIDPVDVGSARMEYMSFHIFAAFFLCALTMIAAVNSFMWKNQRRKSYFVAAAHLFYVVLIYLLSCLQVFDLLFGRPILSHMIGGFTLCAMPYVLWKLTINSTNRYTHANITGWLGVLVKVNFVLPWVLLFVFRISLLETVWMTVATLVVVIMVFFIIILEKLIHFRTLEREEYPCLPLLFLYIGVMADIIATYQSGGLTVHTGLFSMVACVIYTCITYMIFIANDVKTAQDKVEIERSYQRLQLTTLMEQIKAHFIFNTLNTISALCKENPREADNAIHVFATYLRSYMYITNHRGDIPFSEELRLVEAYLSIERMRFGGQVDYRLEIEYDNFRIPSLVVQTLVENAVNHGLRGQREAGKVVVSSRKVDHYVEVCVLDSGVGFDVNEEFSETCTGLRNVKRRLELIEGSEMTIESQLGVGTKISMKLPKIDMNRQDETLQLR